MADTDLELGADDLKALDEMRKGGAGEAAAPEPQETPAEQASSAASAVDGATTPQRTDAQPERQEEQPRDDKGKFAKPPEQEQPDRRVPLAELIEERKARQKAEQEFNQFKGTIEERLRTLQDRIKPAEKPAVSVDENPIEALKQTRQQVEQLSQLQLQQLQRVQFAGSVAAQVHQFKTTVPDYDDAYKYAVEATKRELVARGYPPAQIPAILENGEFQLAEEAIRVGKNPGQHFYDFAIARGYQKADPKPTPSEANDQIRAASIPSAEQKLQTIAKGQQAARSLGSAGGAADTALSIQSLVEMTPEQLANLPEDQFRKIMGAR